MRQLSLVVLCALMLACQAAQQAATEDPSAQSVVIPESARKVYAGADGLALKEQASVAEAPSGAARAQDGGKTQSGVQDAMEGVYLIRSANVGMRVKRLQTAVAQVRQLAIRQGGFVSESNESIQEGQTPVANLTLRIPAARFDHVLGGLTQITDADVLSQSTASEDVSLEYVDTQSRVRNLKREEARLLKLLERSGKLADILTVERELSRVRQEIEQAEGRVRQLSRQVALATITVSLTEQVTHVEHGPWQLASVWQDAWSGAQRALAATVTTWVQRLVWFGFVWIPTTLPWVLLYLLGGWGLGRLAPRHLPRALANRFWHFWSALGVIWLGLLYPTLWMVLGLFGLSVLAVWGGTWMWDWVNRRWKVFRER